MPSPKSRPIVIIIYRLTYRNSKFLVANLEFLYVNIKRGSSYAQWLTITLDEQVYAGFHNVIGRLRISPFIESLVRPHVMAIDLEASYRGMAADEEAEQEALEWTEGLIGDVVDDPG